MRIILGWRSFPSAVAKGRCDPTNKLNDNRYMTPQRSRKLSPPVVIVPIRRWDICPSLGGWVNFDVGLK
jgi:hypothetical protein